jgi:hypothetical protein
MLTARGLRSTRRGSPAWIVAELAPLAVVGVLLVTSPRDAAASDCKAPSGLSACIDGDDLWPHTGGGSFFSIGTTSTTPAGLVSVGLVGSFFKHSIGVRVSSADPGGSTVYLVDDTLDATLLLALGVTRRLEITAAAPATVYQDGAGIAAIVGSAPPAPHSAVRDVRFGLALVILERAEGAGGPALAGRLEFAAPTATADAFAGNATAVLWPSLALSWRLGRVDLAAELGARVRGAATLANAVVGSEIQAAIGANVDILRERWLAAGVEAFALATTTTQLSDPRDPSAGTPPLIPAEWIAHVSTRHFAAGALTLGLGGGTTLPVTSRFALTSPSYRLDLAVRYAPLAPPLAVKEPR